MRSTNAHDWQKNVSSGHVRGCTLYSFVDGGRHHRISPSRVAERESCREQARFMPNEEWRVDERRTASQSVVEVACVGQVGDGNDQREHAHMERT